MSFPSPTVAAHPPSLDRALLRLALPAIGTTLLKGLFVLTDAWWCGRLGADGLAAFGTASFFGWGLTSLSLAASVGLAARVARATGARDPATAGRAARDGLGAAFLVAAVAGLALWLAAPALVDFQGGSPGVREQALAYLRALVIGAPAWCAHDAADAALRATGDTRTPARAGLVAVLANFLIDPLLIFGWGPLPGFGVAGVGFATGLSQTGTALYLWSVVRRRQGLASGRPTAGGIAATLRIGTPSALLGAGFAGIYVGITPQVAAFGTAQLAAMAIGHRCESVVYLASVGYAGAAQALVGQALGAGDVVRARAVAVRAAWHGGLWAAACSVVLALGGATFARFFTADPASIAAGATYLAIVALSLAPQTVEQVLTGAFEGAGDTLPPLWVGVVAHGARLPLILLATSLGLGVEAIWWVIAGCSVAAGLVLAAIFARRRWR
ncbi:MATE family efflux transporter [Vulgatibacter sp.]|uniref:MATE family efflux transporter n=1 Tax=Vulgatibacter sp. TaxID=1971226 RepID=UPI003568B11C